MNTSLQRAVIVVLGLALGPATLGLAKGSRDPAVPATPAVLEGTPRERQVASLVTRFVEQSHYSRLAVDDELSAATLKTYLETLDGNRHYFLQSDIDYFDRYRNGLDEVLRNGDLEPVFDIFRLYRLRTQQSLGYAITLLDKEPDFTLDESYEFDREKLPWAQTPAQLQDLWRKRVKNDAVSLLLADKDWKSGREVLRKRYQRTLDRINTMDSDEVFEAFMNSFARTVDPHSNYLSPRQSEEYKIQMSLSYQGIGASLQLDEDIVQVVNVIAGGPAAIDGRIKPNDRIIAVGQGDAGELTDVVGWQLDDVVQLIRGPAGTKVRLQIQSGEGGAAGNDQILSLVRDKVRLEEQAAKKEIVQVQKDGETVKVGVIRVPSFYQDFEARSRGDKDYTSTTQDVRRLLGELKRDRIAGLVLDLRGNGGGHLSEAVGLTNLFVGAGPVVQVRYGDGRVEVEEDQRVAAAYSGPLVVLVDRFSASASEIFAAAIQDYRRGIVIGQQTYGKGTVQNLFVLDERARRTSSERGLGQLTLTIGKFYRVTGGSTQHRGVIPDIALPSGIDSSIVGESSRDRALPWDQIASRNYPAQQPLDTAINALVRYQSAQLGTEPDFRYLRAELAAADELRSQRTVSLNLAARRAERDALRNSQLERENARRVARGLPLLKSLDDIKPDTQPDVLKDAAAELAVQLSRVGGASTPPAVLTRAQVIPAPPAP